MLNYNDLNIVNLYTHLMRRLGRLAVLSKVVPHMGPDEIARRIFSLVTEISRRAT